MSIHKGRIAPLGIAAIITASTIATTAAQADIITYDILWSGEQIGTTAVGSITIDTVLAPNNGSTYNAFSFPDSVFSDFSVTISGTGGGDGTFTSAAGQFVILFLETSGFVDYTSELVAQGTVADFNFFGGGGSAPSGFGPNIFTASSGQSFHLASITPVPAPGALALLGLGGLVGARRRR